MPENIRALIVVLALAVPAFYIGRQLAAEVISPREFAAWRNVWFAVTIAAFLSGSFLVFAAIETMICLYVRSTRVATPALFVVLLLAVPLVNLPIGGFEYFNSLLDINNGRLLAIVLLLPMFFVTGGSGRRNGGGYSMPDKLIVGYVLLVIVLSSENVTQFARGDDGVYARRADSLFCFQSHDHQRSGFAQGRAGIHHCCAPPVPDRYIRSSQRLASL